MKNIQCYDFNVKHGTPKNHIAYIDQDIASFSQERMID